MGGNTPVFDRQPLSLKDDMEAPSDFVRRRPETETHLTHRPDRVAPYLLHKMNELTFDEFRPEFLIRAGIRDVFSGVPVPLRDEDREAFKTSGGLQSNIIAENMARVLGIDPKFKHRSVYIEFIDRNFGEKAVDDMTRKAKDYADLEDYEDACIYFRAGLVLKHNDLAAMYGYARVLRTMYMNSDEQDYIGNLKAESIDFFEMTTECFPDFDMGWYYLGYMYLNLGLYTKAQLAWSEYLKWSRVQKDCLEIKKRLEQLKEPVEIERGYNAVLSGRWGKGLEILERYKESGYNDWWPLWYYLGVAYARTEQLHEAESAFKRALQSSPRHIESMRELTDIYEKTGDKTNLKKYRDKIKLVNQDS